MLSGPSVRLAEFPLGPEKFPAQSGGKKMQKSSVKIISTELRFISKSRSIKDIRIIIDLADQGLDKSLQRLDGLEVLAVSRTGIDNTCNNNGPCVTSFPRLLPAIIATFIPQLIKLVQGLVGRSIIPSNATRWALLPPGKGTH
jgi:hypothetical protein